MRGVLVLCILFMGFHAWSQEDLEESPRQTLKPSPRMIDDAGEQAKADEEFAIFTEDKFANGALAHKASSSSSPKVRASAGRGPASTGQDVVATTAKSDKSRGSAQQSRAAVAPVGTAPTGAVGTDTGSPQTGSTITKLPVGSSTRPGYTPVATAPGSTGPQLPTPLTVPPPQQNSPMDMSSIMQAISKMAGGSGSGSVSGSGKADDKPKPPGSSPGGGPQRSQQDAGAARSRGQPRAEERSGQSNQCRDGRTRDGAGSWQQPARRALTFREGQFNLNDSDDVYPGASGQMTVRNSGGSCTIEIRAESCPPPNSGRVRAAGQPAPPRSPATDEKRQCTMIYKPKNAGACRNLRSGPVDACRRLFSGGGTMELRERGPNGPLTTPSDSLMGSYLGDTGSSGPGAPTTRR